MSNSSTISPPLAPAMPSNGYHAEEPEILCECRNVSHNFILPNGNPLHVLDNISIAIKPKEVVLLLGQSGCGKSTLLRIMAGLIKPTNGIVEYHHKPLTGMNPGVSIVFQSFALYPWMTVMQNVEVVLKSAGLSSTEARARATAVIKTVGLAGFEEAYPREISGGMKQRVGMARALAVDPEILFMDEPFSSVDALTAESLRAEVIDLWSAKDKNPKSILMVSHDIKEVAYMADRIIVLSANPGRVRTVVENKLPRPRDYRSPEFLKLVDYLHDIITGAEMPDVPTAVTPEIPVPTGVTELPVPEIRIFEPLPDVLPTEIVGLLEYLDARGGREDVFKIASDMNREFGSVIAVTKAAEMLDLVDTPKRTVVLAADGQRFLRGSPDERSAIWRQHILELGLFQEIHALLQQQPDHEIDQELVLETIIFRMPQEDYERTFKTVINWGRYGDLFAYDEATEKVSSSIPAP